VLVSPARPALAILQTDAKMASGPVLYDLRQEDGNIEVMHSRNNYTQYFHKEITTQQGIKR
jgi:hypothetical protein